MSLPTHTTSPPLSSSSPRQSPRGTPRLNAPSIDQVSNNPSEQQSYDIAGNTPSLHQEEEIPSAPQPSFQPFFTLIEDANTSEYYHPTVHYIFSDDDRDIVTEAALRSLEAEQDGFSDPAKGKSKLTQQREETGEEDAYNEDEDETSSLRKESLLPAPIPGVRDNYIILDIDHASPEDVHAHPIAGAGAAVQSYSSSPATREQQPQSPSHKFTVTSAHSLTPTWQVLNTRLVPAPTFENNASGEQPSNGGLMLKIHGTAGLPANMLGKERDRERGSQRLEDMMDQFARRLGELRQVIESGEQTTWAEGGTHEDRGTLDVNIDDTSGLNVEEQGEAQAHV